MFVRFRGCLVDTVVKRAKVGKRSPLVEHEQWWVEEDP